MPAGNDSQAALDELADKFGQGSGRAEDLILASHERYPTDLRAAQLMDVDRNATALLDDEELVEELDLDKDTKILSKAVRGDKVVVLVEKNGRTSKQVCDRSAFDVGEEEDATESPVFSSDAAEAYAKEKDLTPETIRQYVDAPEGKNGTFTKKDVAKAAELRAEANAGNSGD